MQSIVLRHPSLAVPADDPARPPAVSQRGRLVDAMVQTVAQQGYADTTVWEVVKFAGVSRTTFYEHFDGKEGCFCEGYRLGTEVMLQTIAETVGATDGDWLVQLRAAIEIYLRTLSGDDACVRTFIVEVATAGEAARAQRDLVHAAFASNFRSSLRQIQATDPSTADLPDESLLGIVAAFEGLVGRLVRRGQTAQLSTLEPVLTHLAIAVLLGNLKTPGLIADPEAWQAEVS